MKMGNKLNLIKILNIIYIIRWLHSGDIAKLD